jgi:hypothetical protein
LIIACLSLAIDFVLEQIDNKVWREPYIVGIVLPLIGYMLGRLLLGRIIKVPVSLCSSSLAFITTSLGSHIPHQELQGPSSSY